MIISLFVKTEIEKEVKGKTERLFLSYQRMGYKLAFESLPITYYLIPVSYYLPSLFAANGTPPVAYHCT